MIAPLLASKLPQAAHGYVAALTKKNPIAIKLSKPRKSKWGDFRGGSGQIAPQISLNNDLPPFFFLIVFIHEWAHFLVWKDFGHKVAPHGREWQNQYAGLLLPLIEQEVFPNDLKRHLLQSLAKPSASSCRDLGLMRALEKYDSRKEGITKVEDLALGSVFSHNNRVFRLEKKARSRYHCKELSTQRLFAFHALAEVTEA